MRMNPMFRIGTLFLLVCAAIRAQTPEVQSLLQKRCYVCHGPQQQMSNLRLDPKDSAMRVIQPGKSDASRLIRMVSGTEAKVMPPVGAHLTPAEVGVLRGWIDAGAPWSAASQAVHWSFQKIQWTAPPAVHDRAWPRNAIDNFILARLGSEGVKPSPEAPKATLVRRVTLDLTGL